MSDDVTNEALYLDDCYLKECDSVVKSVSGDNSQFIVLDKTIFYPQSGGQPFDTGVIVDEKGSKYNVVFVGKFGGHISHEIESSGLSPGDKVHCVIDWERRYKFMKYHTAAHIISEIIHRETGAKITGNQIGEDRSRIDFDLENLDRDAISGFFKQANDVIKSDLPVKKFFLPKEEAFKNPDLFTLKNVLPPDVENIRIVQIGNEPYFDISACGGTHLDRTGEIGGIELVEIKNKGKNNRRIYFKLKE